MSHYMFAIPLKFQGNPLKIFTNQGFLLPICRNICYCSTLKTYNTTWGSYEIAVFKKKV